MFNCHFWDPNPTLSQRERVELQPMKDRTYKEAGVDSAQQDRLMHNLSYWVEQTFRFRPNTVKLPLGYFANVMILEWFRYRRIHRWRRNQNHCRPDDE